MHKINSTLLLFLMNLISILGQDFWEHSNGPFASNVLDIYITSSNTIYVSNYFNGIHKSTDNGFSWEMVTRKIPQEYASKLLVNDKNYIFAGTVAHGLYRSTDNGISWYRLINLPIGIIKDLLLLESDKIYALTQNGLFKSIDDGENWESLSSTLTNVWMTAVTVNNQHKIFVGASNGYLYISNNEGYSWDSTKVSDYTINTISLSINDDIFCGTENGIYKSSNNGQSWILLQNGLPQDEFNIIKSSTSGYVYAVSFDGFYFSFNNGESWDQIAFEANSINSLAIDDSNNVYAGSLYWGRGIYKSTDNGVTWYEINNGIKNSFISYMAQSINGTVWVGTWGQGLYFSTNGGSNWNYSGIINKKISSIVFYNDNILIATSGGIYHSTNNGNNWTERNSGLTNTRVEDMIIMDSCIYIGTFGGGLYRSCNYGENWIKISNSLSSQTIYNLATYQNYVLCGTSLGIFRTSDNGNSWEEIFSIRPQTIFVNSNDDIYVGTVSDGAFVSINGGQTWNNLIQNGLLASHVYSFGEDLISNLYAGTYWHTFASIDNGYTWNIFEEGLPYNTVRSFLTTFDGYVFAGTIGGGVYKSIEAITLVYDSILNINIYSLSQNFPNPFNPETKISFQIKERGLVQIKVFDILGKEIAILLNEEKEHGNYSISFNGSNLSSGVYIYSLRVNDYVQNRKMILIK